MEEPLRLPAVVGAERAPSGTPAESEGTTERSREGADDEVRSMSSTASATQGPVVLWVEDDPQPDAELEELHTRLARVGIELAEFDGDHAALSWGERHLPRVCCVVICASAGVPAARWSKTAERCVELAIPLLLAPVLPEPELNLRPELDLRSKPQPDQEPEPEPEPERDVTASPGLAVIRELPALQVAIFERVAEKFEFVGGALRPKTATSVDTTSATVEQSDAPLLSAVYVQQPSWRKPPVLPQTHVKRLGGHPSHTETISDVKMGATRSTDKHAQSIAGLLASVPGPHPPQGTRASRAASRRRLWPATKAQKNREKPQLRLGQELQLSAQVEVDTAFTVVHGPVVFSSGMPWATRLGSKNAVVSEKFRLSEGETVVVAGMGTTTGKSVEGKRAKIIRYDENCNAYEVHVEGVGILQEMVKRGNLHRPVPKFEPLQRNNVILVTRRESQNVAGEAVEHGLRCYILVYPVATRQQKSCFDEEENAFALDDCAVELNTDSGDRNYGVLSLSFPQGVEQTRVSSFSKATANAVTLRFSSLLDDDSAAIDQMTLWRDRIWEGVLKNRELDAKTNGSVVPTSRFAIVSAPEEEDALWRVLTGATPKQIGQAFEGTERVSLCCPRMHRQNLAVRKELAKGLISEVNFTDRLHRLVDETRAGLTCAHSTIYIVDAAKEELWAKIPDLAKLSANGNLSLKKVCVPITDGILGQVVGTGQPVIVKEPRNDERFDWKANEQETGVRAENMLCSPVLSAAGKVLAVLRLLNKRHGEFRQDDLDVLAPDKHFGKEASFVIEHAQNVKQSLAAKNYADVGGDWWEKWMKEVRMADAAGQKLIVYSRRNWEHRTEPEDVSVRAELNDHWPGRELVLKAGEPIQQFTLLQQREIEWLQSQGFRLEFRRIETVDAVRADLGGGKRYDGEWTLDGKITGKGKMFFADGKMVKGLTGREIASGDRYEGDLLNGNRSGKGKMRFANGDFYVGDWLSDQMHGQGTLDRGGDKYTGSFFKGRRAGQGVQEYTNTAAGSHVPRVTANGLAGGITPTFSAALQGATQQAQPKGKMNLLGRLRKTAQGLLPLRYEGAWKDDLYHGQGKLTRVNGQWELCVFAKGEVVDMLDSGTALSDGLHEGIEYPNGDKYSGTFKGGKMNGPNGKMKYKDGRVFIGDWKDGKRHGFGKMKFPDGRKFKGPWKEDKIDGPEGVMSYPDGRRYCGDWKDNKKHGTGEHTYVDKDSDDKEITAVYIGEFQENFKHGNGRFEHRGSVINRWEESEYNNGKQVRIIRFGLDIPDGFRKYKWPVFVANHVHQCIPNGDTYEGEWKGGQMCGRGRMQYANGDVFEGTWFNNLPHGTGLAVSAAAKGSWVVKRWENGQERQVIKKGTKVDEKPNIDELCWLQKIHEETLKIIHGPEILRSHCSPSANHDSRHCVVIASQPGGQDGIMDEGEKDEIGEWDERHTIFHHTSSDASQFVSERQAIPLERCIFELNKKAGDSKMCVLRIVTREGREHEFTSVIEDEEMAMSQMEHFRDELQAAIERNRDLDSPKFVKGARFAVVAFPTEETVLCDFLIYASAEQRAQVFEGTDKVSICVCWSKEGLYKDAWWDRWTSMVRDAYNDGQTILCFDRRQWSQRTEPRDVFIPSDKNVDWPGKTIELTKGRPIYRHDVASQRQVAWLRKQCDDPNRKRAKQNWNSKRFEFWQVDKTLDVLRSGPDFNGSKYNGEWNIKGLKHGQGNQEWINGDNYKGGWKNGKQHGQGVMEFSAGGHYSGNWKAGVKHGHGKLVYANGDVYDGEWRHDKEHGRGKFIKIKQQSWEISEWSEGKAGVIILSGKVGETEDRPDTYAVPADVESSEISTEREEDDDYVESTSQRLEKKLRALQAKMDLEDETTNESLDSQAEVQSLQTLNTIMDRPAAVDSSDEAIDDYNDEDVEEERDDDMGTHSSPQLSISDPSEHYSTGELIEVLDEMDSDELQHACTHHAISVHSPNGSIKSVSDMREMLKVHYRSIGEIPEDIRAPSPVVILSECNGELQTFTSQSTAKVAGFRRWAKSRGVQGARLGYDSAQT